METNGKNLVDHWSWAASKGLMNQNTAGALRAACSQILGALDNWETIDVSTIDIDDTFKRFKNLRAKDFTPDSLASYERRFRRALESYLDYARDPGAWKPSSQNRPTKPGTLKNGKEKASPKAAEPAVTPVSEPTRGALVDYPFPLRDGLTVRLMLPRDVKKAEVKRLYAFMCTLSVDFEDSAK